MRMAGGGRGVIGMVGLSLLCSSAGSDGRW